jgi:hypothetical protein
MWWWSLVVATKGGAVRVSWSRRDSFKLEKDGAKLLGGDVSPTDEMELGWNGCDCGGGYRERDSIWRNAGGHEEKYGMTARGSFCLRNRTGASGVQMN